MDKKKDYKKMAKLIKKLNKLLSTVSDKSSVKGYSSGRAAASSSLLDQIRYKRAWTETGPQRLEPGTLQRYHKRNKSVLVTRSYSANLWLNLQIGLFSKGFICKRDLYRKKKIISVPFITCCITLFDVKRGGNGG